MCVWPIGKLLWATEVEEFIEKLWEIDSFFFHFEHTHLSIIDRLYKLAKKWISWIGIYRMNFIQNAVTRSVSCASKARFRKLFAPFLISLQNLKVQNSRKTCSKRNRFLSKFEALGIWISWNRQKLFLAIPKNYFHMSYTNESYTQRLLGL